MPDASEKTLIPATWNVQSTSRPRSFISNRHPNFLTTFKLKQTSKNIKYFKSEAKFSTFLQFGSMEAVKQNEKCALVLLKANE